MAFNFLFISCILLWFVVSFGCYNGPLIYGAGTFYFGGGGGGGGFRIKEIGRPTEVKEVAKKAWEKCIFFWEEVVLLFFFSIFPF